MHLDRKLMRLPGNIGSLACAAVDGKSCLSEDFVCLELPALKNGLSGGLSQDECFHMNTMCPCV